MAKKPIKIIANNPIYRTKRGAPIKFEKPSKGTMSYYGAIRFTLKETAACLGMSYETLNKFLKADPELKCSYEAGHSKAIASVSHQAFKHATAPDKPNATFRWLESNDKDRWLKRAGDEEKDVDNSEELKRLADLLLQAARNPTKK